MCYTLSKHDARVGDTGRLKGCTPKTSPPSDHRVTCSGGFNGRKRYQNTGHVTPVDSDEWQKPYPHWIWKDSGSESVQVSADITINGENIGTVSVFKQVDVIAPYHDAFYATHGASYSPFSSSGQYYNPDDVMAGDSQSQGAGMEVNAAVGTPATFAQQEGYGSFFYAQLIKVDRNKHGNSLPVHVTTSGFALDNGWPYKYVVDARSTATLRYPNYFSDSPSPSISGFLNIAVDDAFEVYLMYVPPDAGEGVQPVALQWIGTGKFLVSAAS